MDRADTALCHLETLLQCLLLQLRGEPLHREGWQDHRCQTSSCRLHQPPMRAPACHWHSWKRLWKLEDTTWAWKEPESSLPSSDWWPKEIWSRSKAPALPAPSKWTRIFPNLGGRKWRKRRKLKWKESSGPERGKQPRPLQQPRTCEPRGQKKPGSPNLGAQSPGPLDPQPRTEVNSFLVSSREREKWKILIKVIIYAK